MEIRHNAYHHNLEWGKNDETLAKLSLFDAIDKEETGFIFFYFFF